MKVPYLKERGTEVIWKCGTVTFFLIQRKVNIALLLHTMAETVKGKQVAFPAVPLKVESPVKKHREAHQRWPTTEICKYCVTTQQESFSKHESGIKKSWTNILPAVLLDFFALFRTVLRWSTVSNPRGLRTVCANQHVVLCLLILL